MKKIITLALAALHAVGNFISGLLVYPLSIVLKKMNNTIAKV